MKMVAFMTSSLILLLAATGSGAPAAQTAIGLPEPPPIPALLEEATRLIADIDYAPVVERRLTAIIQFYARHGDAAAARRVAETHGSPASTARTIATVQATAGDLDGALATLGGQRAEIQRLRDALIEAGSFARARQLVVHAWPAGRERDRELRVLRLAQFYAKDWQGAWETARLAGDVALTETDVFRIVTEAVARGEDEAAKSYAARFPQVQRRLREAIVAGMARRGHAVQALSMALDDYAAPAAARPQSDTPWLGWVYGFIGAPVQMIRVMYQVHRWHGLLDIAREHARGGRLIDALDTTVEMQAVSTEFDGGRAHGELADIVGHIGIACAEGGDVALARDFARRLPDARHLREPIALALARSGNEAEAIRGAGDTQHDRILAEVARWHAVHSALPAAMDAARRIKDSGARDSVFLDVVVPAQVAAGDLAGALLTTRVHQYPREGATTRDRALLILVNAQLQAGQLDDALPVLPLISDSHAAANALFGHHLRALVATGRTPDALRIARRVHPLLHEPLFAAIAEMQARSGEAREAWSWVQKQHRGLRFAVLLGLAEGLANRAAP
jgi:hypothetical protein